LAASAGLSVPAITPSRFGRIASQAQRISGAAGIGLPRSNCSKEPFRMGSAWMAGSSLRAFTEGSRLNFSIHFFWTLAEVM